jgi:hypothetical protein
LFSFPYADAALRARFPKKFFGQFFSAALALPETDHRGWHFQANA